MNKTELIERLSGDNHQGFVSKADATRAVDAVFYAVKSELRRGGTIELAGFGSFKVKNRAAFTGRNPRTGAPILIPERKKVSFSPSKSLLT